MTEATRALPGGGGSQQDGTEGRPEVEGTLGALSPSAGRGRPRAVRAREA